MADDPTVTGNETVRKINSLSHMQLLEYHRIFQPRSFLLNGLCLMGSGMRFPGLLKIYFFIIIISIFFFFSFLGTNLSKKNKNTGSLSWLVIRTNPRSLGFLSGYFQSAYRVQKWAKAEGNFSAKQFFTVASWQRRCSFPIFFFSSSLFSENVPLIDVKLLCHGITLRRAQICPYLPRLSELTPQPVIGVDRGSFGFNFESFTLCFSFISSH